MKLFKKAVVYFSFFIFTVIFIAVDDYRIRIVCVFMLILSVLEFIRSRREVVRHKQLLELQNAISPVISNTLTASPKQLTSRFHTYVKNHLIALNEAKDKMCEANNPKTFINGKQRFLQEIDALCRAEQQEIFPLKPSSSEIKRDFEKKEPGIINGMLSRMWKNCQEEALVLKTQKGRINHIQAHFKMLNLYTELYYPANYQEIKKQKEQAQREYGIDEL